MADFNFKEVSEEERPLPTSASTKEKKADRSVDDRRADQLCTHDTRRIRRYGDGPRSGELGAGTDEI
ncbi:hypothetical protein KOW79_003708 [Hemibagrus wyckioides]|uniref:Uncharacterized protein n=1 Tax=Hemibagrus wyckioides TaxID=337641 RepID=A0A9D3SWC2_9TELE|nr:hypothetical protein KOW79_003708 [Hemibagrus wyckioides]